MSTEDHHCCNVEDEPSAQAPSKQAPSSEPAAERSIPIRGKSLKTAALIILVVLFLVLFLVTAVIVWLLSGFNLFRLFLDQENSKDKNNNMGLYDKLKFAEETSRKFAKYVKFIRSRLVIWVLIWLIVNLCVDQPVLKNKLVLGSELWKWTLLVVLILCGYNFISLASTKLIQLLCLSRKFKTDRNAHYYAKGLKRSANMVVHSSSVLLTWILYFNTSRGIRNTPQTEDLLHVGTWTFITLTVAAFLWFLKNVLLLHWEKDNVYNRFRDRILSLGLHQFFLGHLCEYEDKARLDIFRPQVSSSSNDGKRASDKTQAATANNETHRPTMNNSNKKEPTTFEIRRMAEYFVSLSNASSRDDDGTSQVLDKCKLNQHRIDKEDVKANELSQLLKLEDGDSDRPDEYAKLLLSDLKREHQLVESEKLTYENWEMSMVKAQKNCLALGYSLSDAKEVVEVLNKVTTAVLVATATIAWLLLTGIATNKILALIASPFLAATFIFGEASRKIFEGIMFSFISHPFNVGDLCIIDNKELEVKRMGILTTKFILIETKEEVLYPNSMLATTSIINLKEEPNTNDHVELKLPNGITTKKYESLEGIIKRFLDGGSNDASNSSSTITLEDIGDGTKMLIKYRLNMRIKSSTHSQCLEKKREHKSALLKKIAKCLEMN